MKPFLQILFLLSLTTTFALVIPTSVANAQGPTVTEELGDPLATGETVTGEGNETQPSQNRVLELLFTGDPLGIAIIVAFPGIATWLPNLFG